MDEREHMLGLLQHNVGFDRPDLWTEYARDHCFNYVKACRVPRCPDCGADADRSLGQFVYYSTLIHLRKCAVCELIWADAHIDPEMISRHFDFAYKDERYFQKDRARIFEHLSQVIDRHARPGARVLDIGGAKGHLMHTLVQRRPDLRVTVHDLSREATAWAARHFGFDTISGDVSALDAVQGTFDVIVLSDVLYYEPRLRELWSAVAQHLAPTGAVILRVPNKLGWIRLGQLAFETFGSAASRAAQDRIRFYNPEHIYIFGRRYLFRRLRDLGFDRVEALPSPLISAGGGDWRALFFRLASILSRLSGRAAVMTPSMVVVGSHTGITAGVAHRA